MFRNFLMGLGLALSLSGCVQSSWTTDYTEVPAAQAAALRVTDVKVDVPSTLIVNDQNTYVPEGDIVWHGEPAGDRRAQVAAIVGEAAARGASGLRGRQRAVLHITVERFHGVSPKVYYMDANVGVLDVILTAQLLDARTGAPITAPQRIESSSPARVGQAAREALARGYGQRQEAVDQLTRVFQHWLGGRGDDPRGSFRRYGK